MTTTTAPPSVEQLADVPLTRGRLPRWAPFAVLAGAAVLALLVVLVVRGNVVGWLLLTGGIHVASLTLLARRVEGARKATDRLVTSVVVAMFLLAMLPLVSVMWTVVSEGVGVLSAEFMTYSMRGIVGEGGGVYHALMGTLIVTLLTALISVPIGLMTAIYLVEYGRGTLARVVTFLVDVMTGIPSIVTGLFAYALFVLFLGPGVRMGLAGAVALSVLMIPVVVRSGEEMLKLVPNELREASYALGVPRWRTIVKVVLPTAAAGLATGITLAIARVIGETAPLLIVAGFTASTNFNPFDGRMMTLPVFIYYSYTQPGVPPEFGIERAWGAALMLIFVVMGLNLAARLISHFLAPKTKR